MAVLSDVSIRILDDMFGEAQVFFDEGNYMPAYEKCDDIKNTIKRIQDGAVKKLSRGGAVVGIAGGLIFPGVGNVIGGGIGASIGYLAGKYLASQAFCENGTLEDIAELASAGKQEARFAQKRKHLATKINGRTDTQDLNPQIETLYSRWLKIKKDVLS